jgi:hypothetical protein
VINTNNYYVYTITKNDTIKANFEIAPPPKYTLTLTTNTANAGNVYGDGQHDSGSVVTINAIAKSGYHFVN